MSREIGTRAKFKLTSYPITLWRLDRTKDKCYYEGDTKKLNLTQDIIFELIHISPNYSDGVVSCWKPITEKEDYAYLVYERDENNYFHEFTDPPPKEISALVDNKDYLEL